MRILSIGLVRASYDSCNNAGGELRHRWGSAKLYRAYYQDYRTFLSRPEVTAESISEAAGKRVYVVHAQGLHATTPRSTGGERLPA